MFLKRKRRPQEDDPLVPHGLIWHATAESPGRDQPIPATLETKTANIIEMPPASVPQQSAAGVEAVTMKKPARSAPPFWRSLAAAQPGAIEPSAAAQRTQPPPAPVPIRKESVPSREPGAAAQPSVSPAPRTPGLFAVRVGAMRLRLLARLKQDKENAKLAKARVDSTVRRAQPSGPQTWRSLAATQPGAVEPSAAAEKTPAAPVPIALRKEIAPIPEPGAAPPSAPKKPHLFAIRVRLIRLRMRGRLNQGKETAKRAKARVIANAGRVHESWLRTWRALKASFSRLDPLPALKSLAQKQTTAMRAQSRRLLGAIHLLRKSSWGFDVEAALSPVVRRARAFSWRPPTIGFKAFATDLEILVAREMTKWKLRPPGLPLGRKLVSRALPLTLPALLMLCVIFAVRHYATQALPSHLRQATPAESRPAQAPVRPRPRRYQARAPEAAKVASKRKRQPTLEAKRNRGGHAGDEAEGDYVAPDSYVDYGQKGKAAP